MTARTQRLDASDGGRRNEGRAVREGMGRGARHRSDSSLVVLLQGSRRPFAVGRAAWSEADDEASEEAFIQHADALGTGEAGAHEIESERHACVCAE